MIEYNANLQHYVTETVSFSGIQIQIQIELLVPKLGNKRSNGNQGKNS